MGYSVPHWWGTGQCWGDHNYKHSEVCTTVSVHTWWITVCLSDEVLDNVKVAIATSIVKRFPTWAITWWVTVYLTDEVLDNVEVTKTTSIMKWCITMTDHTWWVTVSLADKILGDVEVTITTSIVKRCITITIPAWWVTVCLTDEVLDDVELTIYYRRGEVK